MSTPTTPALPPLRLLYVWIWMIFCAVGLGLVIRPGELGPWLGLIDDFAKAIYLGTVFTGLFLAVSWWIGGRNYPQQIGQWLWLAEGIGVLVNVIVTRLATTVIQHNQSMALCYAGCYLGIVAFGRQVDRMWKSYLTGFSLFYLFYAIAFGVDYDATALWNRRLLYLHIFLRFGLLMALIGEFAQYRKFFRSHWSEQVGLLITAYITLFYLCFGIIQRFFFYLP